MRDFIGGGKGDKFGINKIDWLPQYAVEEFLYHQGYSEQIVEIRKRRHEKPKAIGLDHLDAAQRKAVLILMEHRDMKEADAIEWVVKHPTEVQGIWR